MSFWRKDVVRTVIARSAAVVEAVHEVRDTGKYHLLCKYLRERFANRVVLTFAEIEDLLGFPLPEAARAESDWWGAAAAASGSAQVDSWTLAGRTAVVNMLAQSVVFERAVPA